MKFASSRTSSSMTCFIFLSDHRIQGEAMIYTKLLGKLKVGWDNSPGLCLVNGNNSI